MTKKDGAHLLRFQMAGEWQEVAVSPMTSLDLKGAIGQEPAPVKARALASGGIALVLVEPGTKIRGHTISTGIALISPFLGPGGTAELKKD